ncbi:acyltransferase [candidate division KSB1 bacterium]|nr:acyltransferase [candidate division KSB1 bacterium]
MKIAFVQMNCHFGHIEANLARAAELIESVAADLFVLPELFNTGYLFQSSDELQQLSESAKDGQTTRFLSQLCGRKNCHIVAGVAERATDGAIYNACVLVGPRGFLATYRKVHLFDTEKRWFTLGNKPFFVVDMGSAKIGMMICFDWIFPESMRSLALLGADIICHPANLVMPHCQKAMVTRCLENNVYAITANRIGSEERGDEHIAFTGCSQIVGPRGKVLTTATAREECVRIVDVDVTAARDKNLNSQNNLLADRRPNFYTY